ncbi:hypothetical protein [Vibrio sp. 99-70-13A1]|uniref:hypothetical protein n=1 Tax=Vibrio sp. 99-70-13A1 TaxID=2607601 RepID=UPI00149386E1|nr:hypothetical protein [Vibrio sp. 99-70-13A1]NOH98369.1 hypothetical protein [Vibrio sp. 99-70-13A1]
MNKNKIVLALGLTSTLGLVGCFDSDSSSGSTSSSGYSVTAIDGYLQNAQVWLDLNGNFALDANEPSATTGAGGKATLDVNGIPNPESYSVIVRAIKGQTIDEDTGTEVVSDYVMSAPAGQQDVTPLSTLVHVILERDDSMTEEQAVMTVATQLGIETDEVLGDFIEDGNTAAAFGAESLVDNNVLPTSVEDLASDADEDNSGSTLLDDAQAVNEGVADYIDELEANLEEGEELSIDDELVLIIDENDPDGYVIETDSDGDGVVDSQDFAPQDATEWVDSDKDLIGDNADLDDDNDGTPDLEDDLPYDSTETSDNDNDGIGDIKDTDDDNDGILDVDDSSPNTPDLSPIEQVIAFMQANSTFYSLWADEDSYQDSMGEQQTDVSIFMEKFEVANNIASLQANYEIQPDGAMWEQDLYDEDDQDIALTTTGWVAFNDVFEIAISSDSVNVYPKEIPTLTSTAFGYVKALAGESIIDNAGELTDYVDSEAVFPEGAEGGVVQLTPDTDQYFLWNQPWFWRASGNTDDDGHNAVTFDELMVAVADKAETGDATSSVKGISLGWDIGVQFVDDNTAVYVSMDWSWDEQTNMPGNVTVVGSGTWEQVTVNEQSIITFNVPMAASEAWGDNWDEDTNKLILSIYDNKVYQGDRFEAGERIEDDDGFLLNEVAKAALLGAINLEGWCPITEVETGATLADFKAQLAGCDLVEMQLEGEVLYRVNGSRQTRTEAFAADNQLLRFKNGEPRDNYWNINEDGLLEIGDDADNLWDYRAYIADGSGEDELRIANFDPEAGEIWMGTYIELDLEDALQECNTNDSEWDDVNEVPTTFFSYAKYLEALDGCKDEQDYRVPKFSSDFISDELVFHSDDERLTFYGEDHSTETAGTGLFEEFDDNGNLMADASMSFTWTMHDEERGIVAMSFSYTDDNDDAQTATDYMALAYSNGIEFNVKVFTTSTEWQGNDISATGEIWFNNYAHPDSEDELTALGFLNGDAVNQP